MTKEIDNISNSNNLFNVENFINMGERYKISEMEFGSKTRATGEKSFLNINFSKKEFNIFSESTISLIPLEKTLHLRLLSGQLSRNIFNKFITALQDRGYKQIWLNRRKNERYNTI